MLRDFFNLLFPNTCMLCGECFMPGEEIMCSVCESSLPKTAYWRHPLNPVQRTMEARSGVKHASSYLFFKKNNTVQQLLHKLKYGGERNLGELLGRLYGYELMRVAQLSDVSYIIPVPLHPRKELQRGFNQSNEIAKGLSSVLMAPYDVNVLCRTYYTASQTGKSRPGRWDNVRNIFELIDNDKIENRHVLLVDDVFTTGATLESCCMALRNGKPSAISTVTIAVADY